MRSRRAGAVRVLHGAGLVLLRRPGGHLSVWPAVGDRLSHRLRAWFFAATIADTSLIWLISAVTLALMTIPNLIGLMLMRREVKALTNEYWQQG